MTDDDRERRQGWMDVLTETGGPPGDEFIHMLMEWEAKHLRAKLEAAEKQISDQCYAIDRISNLSDTVFSGARKRYEAAERERDELRAEVERLRVRLKPTRTVSPPIEIYDDDFDVELAPEHPEVTAAAEEAERMLRKVPRRELTAGMFIDREQRKSIAVEEIRHEPQCTHCNGSGWIRKPALDIIGDYGVRCVCMDAVKEQGE